jgi:hypothetical protein
MKKIGILLILLLPFLGGAQDLSGTWVGKGGGTTYIKLVIRHTGDSLFGYTYDEASDGSYCKATFHGKYYKNQSRVKGYGGYLIENSGSHIVTTYDWIYSKENDGEYLRANVQTGNSLLDRFFGMVEETQWLRRISKKPEKLPTKPATTKPTAPKPSTTKPPVTTKPANPPARPATPKPSTPVKKDTTPSVPVTPPVPTVPEKPVNPPSIVKEKKERSSKLVRAIYTEADSIQLFIYDNGEIDNDTVTVFLNDKVILNKYMITDKAKVLTIPIDKNKEQVVELFANNLGTIPPNTALVVILAGNKRYELFASYDLKTNAKIVFRYGKGD